MKKECNSQGDVAAKNVRKFQRDFFRRAGHNVELLRDMFEQIPNAGFYIKDLDGRIVAINRRNLEYCNISSVNKAIGMRSCDLFTPDCSSKFMENDRWVLKHKRPLINTRYTNSPDRSNRMNVVNVFPVKDEEGRVIGTACCYYRLGDQETNVSDTDLAIQSAVVEINSRYSESIPLRSLSKSVGLSFATFIRRFSEIMNMPPGRYITTTRINRACSLLETTDRLISDIATEVGFCDQSHFIRAFKKIRDTTPSKYRRSHRSISG